MCVLPSQLLQFTQAALAFASPPPNHRAASSTAASRPHALTTSTQMVAGSGATGSSSGNTAARQDWLIWEHPSTVGTATEQPGLAHSGGTCSWSST